MKRNRVNKVDLIERRKKRSKKKTLITVLIIIGSILLLAFLALFGTKLYVEHKYLNLINRTYDSDIEIIPPEEEFFDVDERDEEFVDLDGDGINDLVDEYDKYVPTLPEDVVWDNVTQFDDDELINILLVGQDRRPGQGRQRSDTMILCSINPDTMEISLISFLRDLYVQIPGGYSDNRLNATYVFGGFPLLNQTLEKNFGIHVDYNVEVDFEGFMGIIDYVGGIDIELTEAEADYLRRWPERGKGVVWDLNAGMNHLDAKQALAYARIRKIDSDFGRTNRQRIVLSKLFEKIKDCSFSELSTMAEDILPLLTTDMTNNDIWGLLLKIAPSLSKAELNSYSVPDTGDFYYARIRGMSVIVPYLGQIQDKLEKTYLPY